MPEELIKSKNYAMSQQLLNFRDKRQHDAFVTLMWIIKLGKNCIYI